MRPRQAAALFAAAAAILSSAAAPARAAALQAEAAAGARVLLAPPAAAPGSEGAAPRLNPTGRAVTLSVTAELDRASLGEIAITIEADDSISLDARRLLAVLDPVVDPAALRPLAARAAASGTIPAADFAAAGITLSYDPQALALRITVSSERRRSRSIRLSPLDDSRVGEFAAPARVSAFLNVRGNFDYVHSGAGSGLADPIFYLDGAARMLGTVVESEAIWQPGATGPVFNRLGTRIVHDDSKRLIRWTAGDLRTLARGFQSAPEIAGLSAFRSYSVLEPQRVARPRGGRAFRLDRPATVEIEANGQLLSRLQLQPGNYDLRDFPFAQGANDIRLRILDDAGRTETLRFNLFLDQSQLDRGLSEFGVYAGVLALSGRSGPNYTGDPAFTGFYRRGISETLTLGANAQADGRTQMAGLEGVLATPLGTFSGNLSASRRDGRGAGAAATLTFQRLINRPGGRSDSLTLFAESRTADFSAIGEGAPYNPYLVELGGAYSHAFSDTVYGGLDGRYARGRGDQRDIYNLRATLGIRLGARLSFNGDLGWQQDDRGRRVAGLFALTLQLGRNASARADYDTRFDRARLSYNRVSGQGVGSYTVAADVERSRFGSGANLAASYQHNRAELGFSHYGTFAGDFGGSTSQRSSLRVGTSLALADGAVSLGRPIQDAFAIVQAHPGLKGAPIAIEPTPFGHVASTGALGTGTHPALSAYIERVVGVDAPTAAAGLDLGQGTFRLLPPYRGGYRLKVGSDYAVTAIGRLLDVNGDPVALVTGTATEIAHPERPPIAIFTNREGRFGAGGLAPGRWRIAMQDDRRSSFTLDIPAGAQNIFRAGELTSAEGQ